ncbi:MAG TPA: OmpA family protein [Candidatus Kapabacteria bacterium]|nr:OmpA family protein [Candidatus Kapabacteria bacterium]
MSRLFCGIFIGSLWSSVLLGQPKTFEKLPASVNDPSYSELLPLISADGHWLYFARIRSAADGSSIFDIWRSEHTSDDSFKQAEFVGGNLSSRFGIAVTSIAPDNNTVYLIGKLRANTPPEDRVMVTHRTKDGWETPKPVRIQNLVVKSLYTDYAFGPDQRTLILSMASDSTLGGRDLYVCFLDETSNTWSAPQWLGATINSKDDEITPYLAADGKTLYFSSDRPGATGEVDVWRSERLDDSWKKWSKPEHLDNSVNRGGRITFYTEDAEGKYAYFIWRPNTTAPTAIYRTLAPARIVPVTLIRGIVTDETNTPIEAQIRYERLSDGKTLGIARTDPVTGEYQITLAAGESYAIYADKSGYLPKSERFDAHDVKAFSTIEKNLALIKIKENAVVRLNNIFFETDKATLLPTSFAELDRLADIMKKEPSLRVAIEGHTDSTGTVEHNKKLSQSRAESVVAYLQTKQIAATRLESHGYGSEKPIAPNATEEGKAENRRVEFRVIK